MGITPKKLMELEYWEAVMLCEAIDRDRASQNLDNFTAIGLAFGNFEKQDAKAQIDRWRNQIL